MHVIQGRAGMPPGARKKERARVRRIARRSALLTILSALVPGLGLVATRYRRLGLITSAIAVLIGAALALIVRRSGATGVFAYLAIRPDILTTLTICLVPVTLFWLFAVALTHRETRDAAYDRFQRVGLALLTVAMCAVAVAPLAQFGRYAVAQRDALASVFGGRAERTSGAPWGTANRVNVLLVGSDVGSDKTRVSTDSILVASIDPERGDTLFVTVPSTLQNAPFPTTSPLAKLWPNGYNCGTLCPLGGVWNEAANHPDMFRNDRNPGLSTLKGVVEQITGLEVQASLVVDLKNTPGIIDALGGLSAQISERVAVNPRYDANGKVVGASSWVEPGARRLDGTQALWWLRSAPDDPSRWRRQQCLVRSIVGGAQPMGLLRAWPELARGAKAALTTDVNVADLPAWAEFARRAQEGTTTSLVLTGQSVTATAADYARIRTAVQNALAAPANAPADSVSSAAAAPTAAAPSPSPVPPSPAKAGAKAATKSPTPAPAPAPPPLPTATALGSAGC